MVRDNLPDDFSTLEDFWDFWDSHSSADYEDLMEDEAVAAELMATAPKMPLEEADVRDTSDTIE